MIIIFILLSVPVWGEYDDRYDCRNSTNGKKPGYAYFNMEHMVKNAVPDIVLDRTNLENCSNSCINSLKCQLVEFSKRFKTCKLYFEVPVVEEDNSYDLFYWKFCDLSQGSDIKEWTRGLWFYNVEVKLVPDEDLQIIIGDLQDCKNECRKNPLCGGFNFQETKQCRPLLIWKVDANTLSVAKGWRGYYWVPAEPFNFTFEKQYCREMVTKPCRGIWKVNKTFSPSGHMAMTTFQTRNVTRCFIACQFYINCKMVIFQYSTMTCFLIPVDETKCVKKMQIPKNKVIAIEWECCAKGGPSFGTVTSFFNRKCFEIREPNYVTLYQYNCSNLPHDSNENCFTKWKKHSRNCYEGQSFQSTERTFGGYLIIYNGYETLLLKNATSNNFHITAYELCDLYDAGLPKDPYIYLTLAKDWYSFQFNETNPNVNWPAKRIIVGVLAHPNCLCFEWLHCVEIIRRFQNNIHTNRKINIAFHFMVSPSGYVFEGRGWRNQTKMFWKPNNPDTYYIAFIGNFNINEPTTRSMHAFKSLLKIGIDRKYISEKYYLVLDNDYNHKRFPEHINLDNIIRSQARYKGVAKVDCLQISVLTIAFNLVFATGVCILTMVLSCIYFQWKHTEDCKSLRRTVAQNYLLNFTISILSENAKVVMHYNNDLENYIRNGDCIIKDANSEIFWITERMQMFRCPHCLKKMTLTLKLFKRKGESIKLSRMKMINQNCDKETICLMYQTHSAISKAIIIIIHLDSANIATHVKNIIAAVTNGKCVCSSYKGYLLSLQPAESDFTII